MSVMALAAQHNPGDSLLNFNVSQCGQTTDISICLSCNKFPNRNRMPLVPDSQEHRVCAIGHVYFVVLTGIVFDLHEFVIF